jgi:hypothetical protein
MYTVPADVPPRIHIQFISILFDYDYFFPGFRLRKLSFVFGITMRESLDSQA